MNLTLIKKKILDLIYLHDSSILTQKYGNTFITRKNPNSKHVNIIFELRTLKT